MTDDLELPPSLLALPSYALSLAGREARNRSLAVARRLDLRLGHVAVLAALLDFGPSSQRGLAARLRHDPSDIVPLLDDLEGRGDAKREPDPEDRRRRRVTITPRGRRTLARALAAFEADEAELMAGLSEAERRRLGRLAVRVLADAG